MPIIDQKIGFVDAVNPDLSKFKAHGGKLLLYAGWADTSITPENTVYYYESVVKSFTYYFKCIFFKGKSIPLRFIFYVCIVFNFIHRY